MLTSPCYLHQADCTSCQGWRCCSPGPAPPRPPSPPPARTPPPRWRLAGTHFYDGGRGGWWRLLLSCVLVLSLSVGVEELDVPDAFHHAAPDPGSLACLTGGVVVVVVQVLHLTVGCSVPAQ